LIFSIGCASREEMGFAREMQTDIRQNTARRSIFGLRNDLGCQCHCRIASPFCRPESSCACENHASCFACAGWVGMSLRHGCPSCRSSCRSWPGRTQGPSRLASDQPEVPLDRLDHVVHLHTCLAMLRVKPLALWNGTCDGSDRAKGTTTASTTTGPPLCASA